MSGLDYQLVNTNEEKTEHAHDYAQILLPFDMPIDLMIDQTEYHINVHEIGFITPFQPHQCFCDSQLIVINIPMSMVKAGDIESLFQKTVMPMEGSMISLSELIREEIKRSSPSMRYLYYYLYDRLVEDNSYRSIRYIKEHFDKPINVDKLAKLENYNITYFNNWFKDKTGRTPSRYLRHYRIEKAKDMLLHTSHSVIEIAVRVGYNSHAAFTRAFCNEEGIPPSDYRKSVKQKDMPIMGIM